MFTQNQFDGRDMPLIEAQKQMKKMVDDKVADILNDLPDMLRPIIAEAAKELFSECPEILKQRSELATGETVSEKLLYMKLLFSISNQLGHGASWLR